MGSKKTSIFFPFTSLLFSLLLFPDPGVRDINKPNTVFFVSPKAINASRVLGWEWTVYSPVYLAGLVRRIGVNSCLVAMRARGFASSFHGP